MFDILKGDYDIIQDIVEELMATTRKLSPGFAGLHNDPGSDPSMYVLYTDIARTLLKLVTQPTAHAGRLSAFADLGFPAFLPPLHFRQCTFRVFSILRGEYNVIFRVVE